MSAQDNLSQELFFDAHRGIHATSRKDIETTYAGMHWSAKEDVAKDFATGWAEPGYNHPFVLHAQVPLSSIETNPSLLKEKKVGGVFHKEEEVPVKLGKPIKLLGITKYRGGKTFEKARTRRYNPPREATA
jgi:hypothetical protein